MIFVLVPAIVFTFLAAFIVDEDNVIVAACVISTLQDLLICVLPMRLVWTLNISKRQKIALICIFALGML